MDRGEIYLAPFTYADLQGSKRRPVCVVSAAAFNAGPDVIVAMGHQQCGTPGCTGCRRRGARRWRLAGLLRTSVVRTGRLLVLETRLLSAQLGTLTAADLAAVDQALKGTLGL
ncbi:MAG: type II toxin-antitoxin system PemK/MazF family toxin [Acidimicrobiia bacterium]